MDRTHVKSHTRQLPDDYGVKPKDIERVREKVRTRKIIISRDEYGIVAVYNGKYYSRSVNAALDKARAEYDYPNTNASMGAKKLLGRQYLASLMKSQIWASRIPRDLAIALTYDVGIRT